MSSLEKYQFKSEVAFEMKIEHLLSEDLGIECSTESQ